MMTILRVLAVIGLVYIAFVTLLYVFQERLLYLPHIGGRDIVTTPAAAGLDYEEVNLRAQDGVALHGWNVPVTDPRATLLFFHGNAGNISHRMDSIEIFHRLGLSVLIIDYRGYGQSEGSPSESGTEKDARAAWRWLIEEAGQAPTDIVLFGRSLGAAVAAELAGEVDPAAVILESPFRSVPAIAGDVYPFIPARQLARLAYNTEQAVRHVDAPILVIHSRDDEIIPFSHGLAVHDAAEAPKQMLPIRGGHNTGFLESGEIYTQGIDEFLHGAIPSDLSDESE